jgi:hypothetical protein
MGVASLKFEFGGGGERMRRSGSVELVFFADAADVVDVVVAAVEAAAVVLVVVVGVLVVAAV